MKTTAIITAGGSGIRFPGDCKKQFRIISGKPVIAHAIDNFYENDLIDNIIVTVPNDDLEEAISLLHPLYPNADISIVPGGKTRQKSVLNALNTVAENVDIVLIHDGVRPLISQQEMEEMIHLCTRVKAVIPAHKIKNTIKEVADNRVKRTVPRTGMVAVYTPQVFQYRLIVKYHRLAEQYSELFTDDASILEHFGVPVYVYETESINMKITDIHDFEIIRLIIENNLK